MAKRVIVFALWLGISAAGVGVARAETGNADASQGATVVWQTLHRFEAQALRNYEFHLVATGGASELGDVLWSVARTAPFQRLRETCGSAAETLSYMTAGYYRSGLRRELPEDWHFFAKRYAERRSACLAELKLDENAYPLPRWFGR